MVSWAGELHVGRLNSSQSSNSNTGKASLIEQSLKAEGAHIAPLISAASLLSIQCGFL